MAMKLVPFTLVDGAVVHPSVSRSEVVRAMAAHLVEFDAFRNKDDAILSLRWPRGKFSPYDIMVLVDDARQVAQQAIVAREMSSK